MNTTATIKPADHTSFGISPKKFAMWAAIASICMFFVGLTSALIVKKAAETASGNWFKFAVPNWFYISTAIVLLSSVTLYLAKRAFDASNRNLYKSMMVLTTLLGIGFIACQYLGWQELKQIGVYLGGALSHSSGSFFYVLSGAHAVHIAGGLVYLLLHTFQSFRKPIIQINKDAIEIVNLYWHFVGILWVYIFILLIF
jgi:cytochrome c oxidase subunit III